MTDPSLCTCGPGWHHKPLCPWLHAATEPAKTPTPAAVDGLRKRRDELLAAEKREAALKDWQMADRWRYMASGIEEALAALAATPADDLGAAPELDAQLLARAMDIADDTPILGTGLRRVDVVIREYARLLAASLSGEGRTP